MKFQVYQDRDGKWRWRIRWSNGQIRGDSGQGYRRKSDCIKAILAIQQRAAQAEVEEL